MDVFHNSGIDIPSVGASTRKPLEFHRRLPGYAPTPLIDATSLADRLGLGRVLVKCESDRFGLPSFKILGTSWACYRATVDRLGAEPAPWNTLDELAQRVHELWPLTFVAATDGNHGRAVAHVARWLGFDARIFVPTGTAATPIEAIESEGADVNVIDYDRSSVQAGSRGS